MDRVHKMRTYSDCEASDSKQRKKTRTFSAGETSDSSDGSLSVTLSNDHLNEMEADELYHLGLNTKQHDLKKLFGDVMYVIMGGSVLRMKKLAEFMKEKLDLELPFGCTLDNISKATDRYAVYKVGPILFASHGIGPASLSVALNELFKLLYHAGVQDNVKVFRAGTSGGLGLEPGTVVVTNEAVNGLMQPVYEIDVLGQRERRPAELDKELVEELLKCSRSGDDFKVVSGKTMCANDFYEGQGRLDGAICQYKQEDKMEFLRKLQKEGVKNIEMECVVFAAMCRMVNIKCAIVCVTLIDRLQGDQITHPERAHEWDGRPGEVLARYIREDLTSIGYYD